MSAELRIGSLCSGAGMLDEGVRLVLGGEVAWHCEIDPAASRVLDYRYPGVPNLGDIKLADWTTCEHADLMTAGYPCPPFSQAGQRKGHDDDRNVWPAVAAAIRGVRPRLVFLENVSGHRSLGLDTVLGDLATLGYDARWTCLRDADIGAAHGRERIFILASDARSEQGRERHDVAVFERWARQAEQTGLGSLALTDTNRAGCLQRGRGITGEPQQPAAQRRGEASADTDSGRCVESDAGLGGVQLADGRGVPAWGQYQPAVDRWAQVVRRPAPDPTHELDGLRVLNPRADEWLMGWPDGWVTDVPDITRNDALRICGNGVVPQQAAEALHRLLPFVESENVA